MEDLGLTALALSDPAAARARFQASLKLFPKTQHTLSIGRIHGRIARMARPGSKERRRFRTLL